MPIFDKPTAGYTPKIRIINLVDILLVLLLFLFVTTTFRVNTPNVVKVALPEAETAEAAATEERATLHITVGPDETIYLDEDIVSLSELGPALAVAKNNRPELVLQFSADKAASYGRIVSIVDAARAAGIRDMTAFTKQSVTE